MTTPDLTPEGKAAFVRLDKMIAGKWDETSTDIRLVLHLLCATPAPTDNPDIARLWNETANSDDFCKKLGVSPIRNTATGDAVMWRDSEGDYINFAHVIEASIAPTDNAALVEEVDAIIDQAHADLDEHFRDAEHTGERPDLQDSETMTPVDLLERIRAALSSRAAAPTPELVRERLLEGIHDLDHYLEEDGYYLREADVVSMVEITFAANPPADLTTPPEDVGEALANLMRFRPYNPGNNRAGMAQDEAGEWVRHKDVFAALAKPKDNTHE